MGDLIDWLVEDEQHNLFEFLVALALNLVFLGLAALLLWPLDRLPLAVSLVRGFGVLWLAVFTVSKIVHRLHRLFRVDPYHRGNVFVASHLAASCVLQLGWAAFAALALRDAVPNLPVWGAVLLYVLGVLSCLVASWVVSSRYQGALYKLISPPLTLAGFLAFSLWPASGRVLYGWFFGLF